MPTKVLALLDVVQRLLTEDSAKKVSGYLVNDVISLKDYLTLSDYGKGYEIADMAWPLFVGWAEEFQPQGVDVDGLNAQDQQADTSIDDIPENVLQYRAQLKQSR